MHTYIPRTIEPLIKKQLGKGRAIILYGPRQVGKTTLAKQLLQHYPASDIVSYQADDPSQAALFTPNTADLKRVIAGKKVIFVDEAQNIENAGRVFKLMVDTFPNVQLIATGSSSFELSDKIRESMIGRTASFTLLPFSVEELASSPQEQLLFDFERAMRFGGYPAVALALDTTAKQLLHDITTSYLYRDVLALSDVRNPEILGKLLQALALQVGQEVSYNELATMLEVNRATIERYIYLLELCFVIFRLQPLSSNPRKLLASRKRKVYFYDLGIRNQLAGQTALSVAANSQIGGIFENFCIVERLKARLNHQIYGNTYYWRSPDSEVDYIEQYNDKTFAYEIKWRKSARRLPPRFMAQFPDALFTPVSRETFWDFINTKE